MKVAITGAFTYTGRYISETLLEQGHEIVNLTGHPERPHSFGDRIKVYPLDFSDKQKLVESLRDVEIFFITYWVRFEQYGSTKDRSIRDIAVDNVKLLVDAAKEAGVKKIVFTSHTKTSLDSPIKYIAGKARCEAYIKESGLKYGFVKPNGLFGDTPEESIMINNIAWVMRRGPLMLVPGHGKYQFHFVHVRDMARLCIEQALSETNGEVDACGPDKMTYIEIIRCIKQELNLKIWIIPYVPSSILYWLSKPLGKKMDDILFDKNEMRLMFDGITTTDDEVPAGKLALRDWIRENRDTLGLIYVSSIKRYYK